MPVLVKKGIEVVLVAISFIAAFLVFKNLKPEKFIKPDAAPITAAQIASAPGVTYTGKTAGEDFKAFRKRGL